MTNHEQQNERSRAKVKSAQRALEILEIVAMHPDGASFVELGEMLPYPKSSLHGLLQTIIDMKWLTFDPIKRVYHVGVRPWEVGNAFRKSREIAVRARQYLREANNELDETVQLGILDDLDVVYIDKVEGLRPLRLVSNVGSRLPAYVTGIGKALLAGMDEETLKNRFAGRELRRYTDRTITSGDELMKVLNQVRGQGYAIDDGEYSLGVFCVGVPLYPGPENEIAAAMSCSVPSARLQLGELSKNRMVEVLLRQASAYSQVVRG